MVVSSEEEEEEKVEEEEEEEKEEEEDEEEEKEEDVFKAALRDLGLRGRRRRPTPPINSVQGEEAELGHVKGHDLIPSASSIFFTWKI